MIAVALASTSTDAALQAMQECAGCADVVELRLDLMAEYDLQRLLRERCLPIIVTNRPLREGGQYAAAEEARLDVLAEAVVLGADYVDVEADSALALLGHLGKAWQANTVFGHGVDGKGADDDTDTALKTRLIVSSHNFAVMPDDLKVRHAHLSTLVPGAIPKLAGMARRAVEIVPMMALLRDTQTSTIAIAMGAHGLASRVLALRYPETLLTFAATPITMGQPTAPGQIPLTIMDEVFHCRTIGPATQPVGLLCRDVDMTLLARYNHVLREAGADAVCVPVLVNSEKDVAEVLHAFPELDLRGFAVVPDAATLLESTDVSNLTWSRRDHRSAESLMIVARDQAWEAQWHSGNLEDQVAVWLSAGCVNTWQGGY